MGMRWQSRARIPGPSAPDPDRAAAAAAAPLRSCQTRRSSLARSWGMGRRLLLLRGRGHAGWRRGPQGRDGDRLKDQGTHLEMNDGDGLRHVSTETQMHSGMSQGTDIHTRTHRDLGTGTGGRHIHKDTQRHGTETEPTHGMETQVDACIDRDRHGGLSHTQRHSLGWAQTSLGWHSMPRTAPSAGLQQADRWVGGYTAVPLPSQPQVDQEPCRHTDA